MGYEISPKPYNADTMEVVDESDIVNILLMLSYTDGPILDDDCCDIFRDPKNPFYLGDKIPKNKRGRLDFILSNVFPDDIIDYI